MPSSVMKEKQCIDDSVGLPHTVAVVRRSTLRLNLVQYGVTPDPVPMGI